MLVITVLFGAHLQNTLVSTYGPDVQLGKAGRASLRGTRLRRVYCISPYILGIIIIHVTVNEGPIRQP